MIMLQLLLLSNAGNAISSKCLPDIIKLVQSGQAGERH